MLISQHSLTLSSLLSLVLTTGTFSFLDRGLTSQRWSSVLFSSSPNKNEFNEEGFAFSRERVKPLEQRLINQLDFSLGTFVTKVAIDTTSTYLLEFRNEIDQQWMFKHLNYSLAGFSEAPPRGTWSDWLESMINLSTQKITVIMNPPKAILRGRGANNDNRVRLEYVHDLEPRKIANQILNVRNSVTTELIQDLGCVQTENIEAVRYARNRIASGVEAAEKSRQMTRMDESGGASTPLRDRNYLEIDILVTNFALESVRGDLTKQNNQAGLEFLDGILAKLDKRDVERTVLDRLLAEFTAPRELIEEVYLAGLQQTVTADSAFNALTISEALLQARFAVALEANRILLEQDRFARTLYQTIKDKGGFLAWSAGSRGRAKVKVLDLLAEDEIKANALSKVATNLGMRKVSDDTDNVDKSGKKEESSPAVTAPEEAPLNASGTASNSSNNSMGSDFAELDVDLDKFGAGGPIFF